MNHLIIYISHIFQNDIVRDFRKNFAEIKIHYVCDISLSY